MAANPLFTAAVVNAQVQVATANPNRDGTGTIGTLYAATGDGVRIDDIELKAAGTTTAGMLRLFIHDGANYRLWKEVLVSAITASATVAAWSSSLTNLGLCLQSGWPLRISTEKAETFNAIITRGGTF